METKAMTRKTESTPSLFDDFFKPWNEWFDGGLLNRTTKIPAVNITEHKEEYLVTVAAPGLKKEDFKLDIENNMLTISCEKEDRTEEKESRFTRREYSYSSFRRCFTLPDEIQKEKIEAKYEDGLLKIHLPRKEEVKKPSAKHIDVR